MRRKLWQVFTRRADGSPRQVRPSNWRRRNKAARFGAARRVRDRLRKRGKRAWMRRAPSIALWRVWLVGDVRIPRGAPKAHRRAYNRLRRKVARAAKRSGRKWRVNSGYRSFAEQAVLYGKYLNGTGNLAAKPGASNHNYGRAMDVSVDGVAVGDVIGMRKHLDAEGLHLPVKGEPWHVTEKGVNG